MLDGWITQAANISAGALLERIIDQIGYRKMLEERESAQEAEDRIANVDELVRAAYESQERGETVFEFLDRASLSSELDQFDPDARVALLTVHSAKGLEFDVVFLAGLEEGLFPHFQSRDAKEDLEEERRLCYVGMTRARGKLFLTWTPYRRNFGPDAGIPSRPSRFLNEVPAELVEGLDLQSGYVVEEEGGYREEKRHAAAPEAVRRAGADAGDQPRSLAELRAYLEKRQSEKSGAPATGGPVLKLGMRVRHAQFGDGIILSRERSGNEIKLTITFSRVGRKTLIERYARLQAL
jgi:DNA helicase-2/ATP-dependent DNA helicase PcrA